MPFSLIDQITEFEANSRISAIKALSLGEEYLQDHFPRFPVMPGVLMLEAMYQASAWLIRKSEDFTHSMVMLQEARKVNYGEFVAPGRVLRIEAEILKQDEQFTTLKASGTIGSEAAVSARLKIHRYNLADIEPDKGPLDYYIRADSRRRFEQLFVQ